MGGHDVPAVLDARPALLLATGFAGQGVAVEQGGGGGEVPAECRDDSAGNHPCEARGGSCGAERADLSPAMEDLTDAVTDGVGAVPEQSLERIDIVGHQRGFITG